MNLAINSKMFNVLEREYLTPPDLEEITVKGRASGYYGTGPNEGLFVLKELALQYAMERCGIIRPFTVGSTPETKEFDEMLWTGFIQDIGFTARKRNRHDLPSITRNQPIPPIQHCQVPGILQILYSLEGIMCLKRTGRS